VCIAVLDEDNRPVTGELFAARVKKDGLVVDYSGSVALVRRLKGNIEARLGRPLEQAAVANPPGTEGKNAQVISNVVQSAGFEVINVVDESTAAATAMGALEGAVVDVGGGTTGISILREGKAVAVYDEPCGGSHMTLVLAGNYGIPTEEAEKIKLDPANQREVFSLVKPVIEKMAVIVHRFVQDYPEVDTIYVAGGAGSFDGFEGIMEKECGIKTVKPNHGVLITPLGIAMHCMRGDI
jgi:ethanolamine utilization protein EutJ